MGVLADQSSVPVPARVSRDDSSASQSATSPGLLAGLATATPLPQPNDWADVTEAPPASRTMARSIDVAMTNLVI